MKSKKTQEFIDRAMKHIVADLSDHAKWQRSNEPYSRTRRAGGRGKDAG